MAGHVVTEVGAPVRAWAGSGAMALTGRRGRPPLGPPAALVDRLIPLGDRLGIDALAVLGERAAIAGLGRNGEISCGGATRLLRSQDGWVALALARPEDLELVPALLEGVEPEDPWGAVRRQVRQQTGERFVQRTRLLGLPASVLPPRPGPDGDSACGSVAWATDRHAETGGGRVLPVVVRRVEGAAEPLDVRTTRVADLGSLWAGPLCGALLGAVGAEVVKVESTRRPDGARAGPAAFFDLLNGGKSGLALDLRSSEGVGALAEVLRAVDVVIEASRPRALEQLGIDREVLVAAGGPRVWVSITGHGREGPARDRVAFGDDAAAAGGLVVWDGAGPCFCADAVADPLAGMVAAASARDALARGGRWLIDVAMADVAAWFGGPTLAVPDGVVAAVPRHRAPAGRAPRLGEHTAAVLAGLGR
jgi:crotonobetainyl-CoA:carnitine CoA-transferase CaiB-like acyl-CoA transferase